MLQHSSAELAVCRETWDKGRVLPPSFDFPRIFSRPLRGRKGGRKEGKVRKKREGTTLLLHVLVLVMSACALGHLLVMSACALGAVLGRACQS